MVNVGSVEEPARAVLGSKPERDRPRMDPPNVLWFAGTYAIAVASYALLGALPKSHSSVWIFLAALAFLVVYSAASHGLVRTEVMYTSSPRPLMFENCVRLPSAATSSKLYGAPFAPKFTDSKTLFVGS